MVKHVHALCIYSEWTRVHTKSVLQLGRRRHFVSGRLRRRTDRSSRMLRLDRSVSVGLPNRVAARSARAPSIRTRSSARSFLGSSPASRRIPNPYLYKYLNKDTTGADRTRLIYVNITYYIYIYYFQSRVPSAYTILLIICIHYIRTAHRYMNTWYASTHMACIFDIMCVRVYVYIT